MRFKTGTKVEVFCKREVPSGAWRRAEIISGNGHYYTVRYENYVGTAADEERVPRKSIRPLPPPMEVVECWVPGDIIEVFENSSWKMAAVSEVLERDCFLVRLLGSSLEIRATQFDIRVRQSWQNDEWIMIGQGSKGGNEGQRDRTLSPKCRARLSSLSRIRNVRRKLNPKGDIVSRERKDKLDHFDVVSSKGLKRQQPYSLVEPNGHTALKTRAVCERYDFGSVEYQTGNFLVVDSGKRKDSGNSEWFLAKCVEEEEDEETDSVASSIGSCSIGTHVFVPTDDDIDESTSSDAESFCGSESHRKIIKNLAPELHGLELDAYRGTIERLHASGPITWEQEAWITNLRLTLNISNDEHLMQVRSLVSADNSTVCR